jgi:cytochrome c oxidase subunit 3
MTTKTATEELELLELEYGHRGPGEGDFVPGGNDGEPHVPAVPQHTYLTGIVLALAAILMFFLALTSSFIVRKGLSTDWVPFRLPPILWLNTGLLLVSSFTLESARRQLEGESLAAFRRWWGLTSGLGMAFLAGQILAWQQLAAAGVFLDSNPSNSFFYLLTGLHGLHLLGGIIALLYVGFGSRSDGRLQWPTAVKVAGIYWHFMGALWVYLFLLLLLGQ